MYDSVIISLVSSFFMRFLTAFQDWGGGGGAKCPSPNLAISGQMTVKLGRDILLVGIFTNWPKFFDDVIVNCHADFMTSSNATAKKVEGFLGILLNISKTAHLLYHV